MLKTFIERIDIYLVVLVLVSAYILILSDGRYFCRGGKERAKKQSIALGVGMLIITLGLYLLRHIWI